jgi:GT2 family glycosyltransferase/glycosyltransferase involved in cell wall biosynthesis
MKTVSIILLNWNGKELLTESLPALRQALSGMKGVREVIVADNGSTDGSPDLVRTSFPEFHLLEFGTNLGFGEGNNRAALSALGELLLFLNNDMIVDREFLPPLLHPFSRSGDVFAVASQVFFSDAARRREETGKTTAWWDRGIVRFAHQPLTPDEEQAESIPIFWAGGGAAVFDRSKFLALGGFRTIYSPAYVEDADLSYRALKRGWKVLLAPKSRVIHKHRATSSRMMSPDQLESLIARNRLLFVWSNLTDRHMMMEHLLTLPLRCLWSREPRGASWWRRGISRALPMWGKARRLAMTESAERLISDRDLLVRGVWRKRQRRDPNRLSILFVCPYLPKLGIHAGAARMYEVIKGVSRYHDVSVLTFIEREEEREAARELQEFCRNVRLVVRKGWHPERNFFLLKPQHRLREFAHPEMKRILQEEVSSGKYDVVQYEYLEMAYLKRYAGTTDAVNIFTHHEVQHRSLRQEMQVVRNGTLDALQRRIQWMKMLNFELAVARSFDTIITMTDADRRALIEYNPKLHVVVHETGVHVPLDTKELPPEEPRSIVFLGYFKHLPNEDAVLYFVGEVFPHILKNFPDAKFTVVGAEPGHTIRALHDGRRIIVTGRVEDVRPFLARGSVFVAPIRLGAGIRGKILEAWAVRRPVVSTTLGCSGIQARNGENILIADQPLQFAAEVCRLFEDSALRRQLGEYGYETALQHYAWPLQVQKHLQFYEEAVGRRR